MTVISIYGPVNLMGNGATVVFAFPYQFFAPADLVVSLWDVTANAAVAPPPVLNGSGTFDYTVSGTIENLGTGEYLNGSVTFHSPPPGNVQVTIERRIAALQPVALADDSLFPAKTVEAEFDRLQMQIQENASGLARAVVAPASDGPVNLTLPPASVRASKYFVWDGDSQPAVADLPALSTIANASGQEVFISQAAGADDEARLLNADAAAAILGGVLVIDRNVTLTANRILAAPFVRPAGGVITRGSRTLTFNGVVVGHECIAFLDRTGTGTVSFGNKTASLAWFGAKQDSTQTIDGPLVTDNALAMNAAVAAANGGKLIIPLLAPGKTYGYSSNPVITAPTEIKQDNIAYLRHTGNGYGLTYNAGGPATGMDIAWRVYGSSAGQGGIKYKGNTGLITDRLFVYGYANGEAIAYEDLTFNYLHINPYLRNARRMVKERAGYKNVVNAVRFLGGLYQNDTSVAVDPNGWFQLDRGNGWQFFGKPVIEQGHPTPAPLIKLAQIAYTDSTDSQVQNIDIGDCYFEGAFTQILAVGVGATFPSTLQMPRDIYGRILQSSNPATDRLVRLRSVQGSNVEFGYNMPGSLFEYDAACDCTWIRMLQALPHTTSTGATHSRLEATYFTSFDNDTTNIIGAMPPALSVSYARSIQGGLGSPEGVISAPPGSHYLRADGGAGTSFYVKESGGFGNTGWVGK